MCLFKRLNCDPRTQQRLKKIHLLFFCSRKLLTAKNHPPLHAWLRRDSWVPRLPVSRATQTLQIPILLSGNPAQNSPIRGQHKAWLWITGQKDSCNYLHVFPLNKVFPASRWEGVPYRASVIGSQPVLGIFHSWHQDKLIFFTKLTPITFIFIAHNQLMGYNLIQRN